MKAGTTWAGDIPLSPPWGHSTACATPASWLGPAGIGVSLGLGTGLGHPCFGGLTVGKPPQNDGNGGAAIRDPRDRGRQSSEPLLLHTVELCGDKGE